jgi:hypothetical protein
LLGLAFALYGVAFLFYSSLLLAWYEGTLFMDMYRSIDQVVGYSG